MNKFDLKNRVSVVTGAAQGFGFAIAKKFLDCGAEVIAWDIDKEALNMAQKNLKVQEDMGQLYTYNNFLMLLNCFLYVIKFFFAG